MERTYRTHVRAAPLLSSDATASAGLGSSDRADVAATSSIRSPTAFSQTGKAASIHRRTARIPVEPDLRIHSLLGGSLS